MDWLKHCTLWGPNNIVGESIPDIIRPIVPIWTLRWSYLLLTVQVHTIRHYRCYREQCGPASPKTGPVPDRRALEVVKKYHHSDRQIAEKHK